MTSFQESEDTNRIARREESQESTSSSQQHGSTASTGKMSTQNTEAQTIQRRKDQAQTVIDLCPQFLKHNLKLSNYDKEYNLLEAPVFVIPAKKIKDGESREAEIDLLKSSIKRIEYTLRPAKPQEQKEALGRLALHKGIGSYSEGHLNALINDYMRLLADCPYDLLSKACDECILDPDMQYFPQVGRLRDKMGKEMTLRQLYLGRLRKILELSSHIEQRQEKPRAKELGRSLADKFKV